MATVDSTLLNKSPRLFAIVSVRSGHSVTLRDDGASINTDGTHPNGNRQHCILQAGKRHTHGGKGRGGPSIASWVTERKLDRSTGDGKYDPGVLFKCLDDVEIIDGKSTSYREIVEANKAVDAARRENDVVLSVSEARRLGANEAFLTRLDAIVANIPTAGDVAAATASTAKKG